MIFYVFLARRDLDGRWDLHQDEHLFQREWRGDCCGCVRYHLPRDGLLWCLWQQAGLLLYRRNRRSGPQSGNMRRCDVVHGTHVWGQTQQARDVDPMLIYCRASVADGGPAINQHWPTYDVYWETTSCDKIISFPWIWKGINVKSDDMSLNLISDCIPAHLHCWNLHFILEIANNWNIWILYVKKSNDKNYKWHINMYSAPCTQSRAKPQGSFCLIYK